MRQRWLGRAWRVGNSMQHTSRQIHSSVHEMTGGCSKWVDVSWVGAPGGLSRSWACPRSIPATQLESYRSAAPLSCSQAAWQSLKAPAWHPPPASCRQHPGHRGSDGRSRRRLTHRSPQLQLQSWPSHAEHGGRANGKTPCPADTTAGRHLSPAAPNHARPPTTASTTEERSRQTCSAAALFSGPGSVVRR